MGNRIIFDVSIDIEPFRKAIDEMTKITNAFFDMADYRAGVFSETLGGIGSNFNISEQFDSVNASIAEGAEAISRYNDSFQSVGDTIFDMFLITASAFGPKGAIVALFALGLRELSHYRIGMSNEFRDISDISLETLRSLDHSWGAWHELFKDTAEDATGTVAESYRTMADEILEMIYAQGNDWIDIGAIRRRNTEETNEAVIESFKDMMGDISADVIGPMNYNWDAFYKTFKEGAKYASYAVKESFEAMSEGVSLDVIAAMDSEWGEFNRLFREGAEESGGAVKKSFHGMFEGISADVIDVMGLDWDAFYEKFKKGANDATNAVKNTFGKLPKGVREPFNGVVSLINGKSQRVVMGLNSVIGGINAMGFDLPPWLSGGSFRPNIKKIPMPQIPALARGGIVDRPTLALIGERGKEAVMPLENNTGWITDLANSIGAVVGAQLAISRAEPGINSMLDSIRPIKLYLDGRKVAEGIMNDFVEVARQQDVQLSPMFI